MTKDSHVPPNGWAHSSVWLSISLFFFARVIPLHIALVHGMSRSEMSVSTWRVVDATHNTPSFIMQFPECHKKQNELFSKFKAISAA